MALRNYDETAQRIQEVADDALDDIADDAIRHIVSRTRAGYDVHGRRFAPYSVFTRKKRTRRRPSHTPDLFDFGHMLSALREDRPRANQRTITISGQSFSSGGLSERNKGRWHQTGTEKMPQREWFGIQDGAALDLLSEGVRKITQVVNLEDRRTAFRVHLRV